ncbi:MAG: fumarate hydratase [Turicibacter sp.]|nr:fumarate hydratase [Turicibacter sp.]
MREINSERIVEVVAELCVSANVVADGEIERAICAACERETSVRAKNALEMIVENMELAKQEKMPMCQDTGMVVVFLEIGQDLHIKGDLRAAVNEGVRKGYKDGYFRASVVEDPIRRENTKDNTPAIIHFDLVAGDKLKIIVMPKGFGSENKGGAKMLTPSAGIAGVEDFVIETVQKAGSDSCPPIIVGVGVGGTMDYAALLAKKAILNLEKGNSDPYWAEIEGRLLEKINALGVGAAGFKGITTALFVRILTYPTHIAGLPVAVNVGCHVSRHKSATL